MVAVGTLSTQASRHIHTTEECLLVDAGRADLGVLQLTLNRGMVTSVYDVIQTVALGQHIDLIKQENIAP